MSANSTASGLISRARTQMLFKSPFFAFLALNLEVVESKEMQTCATDGRHLFYSPDFVKQTFDKNKESVYGLILHEVMHAALGHMWRRGTRNNMIWNIACDYAVNWIVTQNGFVIPEDGLLDSKWADMSSEQIYAELYKHAQSNSNEVGNGSGDGSGDKKSKEGTGEQKWGSHEKWGETSQSPAEQKEMENKWKQVLSQAVQNAKARGNMPLGMERLVNELLFPKMNWREALMKYLTPDNSDYTLTPMNKKLLPQEIIAPSMKEESLKDIVISIDTSGSIDNEDLKVFMSELNGILRSFRNVSGYVTACDADVHDFFEFDSNNDVASMKVHGGGGTDFRPVFNRIKEKWLTPACVVFFTDGDGTFPPEADYPDYPVLWVIKNSQKTEASFGITVYFE